MSLESLLKVLCFRKITIYKDIGCSGTQCHFEELYSGSRDGVPKSLLTSNVLYVNADNRGVFDVMISGV